MGAFVGLVVEMRAEVEAVEVAEETEEVEETEVEEIKGFGGGALITVVCPGIFVLDVVGELLAEVRRVFLKGDRGRICWGKGSELRAGEVLNPFWGEKGRGAFPTRL